MKPSALSRRAFAAGLASAGLAPLLASVEAKAQAAAAAPIEGVNYVRLVEPAPVRGDKIEVIEFFWYECPHCNAFEPALEAWTQRLPDDVAFRRVPAWFREESFGPQQRLFYSLESLGLLTALHRRVFNAIHADRQRLRNVDEITAFMVRNGVDADRFMAAYRSFGVQTKAQQARQLADAYKIDAVPAMAVHGRYYTTGAMAGAGAPVDNRVPGNDRMLGVVDALVAKVRSGDRL